MMSVVSPARKRVGFAAPALTEGGAESDSSDSQDDPLHTVMKKAKELTTKRRLQRMVGDAIQLEQRNNLALKDLATDQLHLKQRRLTLLRSASRKEIVVPKMADIVMVVTEKPIVKFRRRARAVMRLIQVCHICKDLLSNRVRQEPWYALIDNLMASTVTPKRKAPRPFVTFVPNERRQLVQLTFDVADYKRECRSEFSLTNNIREMMSVMPGCRSPQQVAEILGMLKALFRTFSHYRLSTQKAIAQYGFYDKYKANRVIIKKGHWPDGIFFILSGCVVEKHEGGKQPRLINTGEKFGEGDLLCGNRRRHTVLTKLDSEIFYLHKQDYRDIFALVEDRNNPRNLDVCKQHIVFQHFPMYRLMDNPGTWSVNTYKYGELIAGDLHTVDWIYVIKSGEARVLKYLEASQVDVQARRRKVQAVLHRHSPFHRKTQLLHFMEQRHYIRSSYGAKSCRTPSSSSSSSASHRLRSAPPASSSSSSSSHPRPHSTPALPSRPGVSLPHTARGPTRCSSRKSSSAKPPHHQQVALPRLLLPSDPAQGQPGTEVKVNESLEKGEKGEGVEETTARLPADRHTRPGRQEARAGSEASHGTGQSGGEDPGKIRRAVSEDGDPCRLGVGGGSSKRFPERRLSADVQGALFQRPLQAGQPDPRRRQSLLLPPPPPAAAAAKGQGQSGGEGGGERRGSGSVVRVVAAAAGGGGGGGGRAGGGEGKQGWHQHLLPAFVQVETLHPGQAFGLRACLDPEERGPSVSLVSGDCEVLQINKKFFMRHCDDAIYSLIRLKSKPFPGTEELMDRLDVNLQWEEFKQQCLHSLLLQQCRSAR